MAQAWAALPPLYQNVMRTASAEVNQWLTVKYDTENPAALRRLMVKLGVPQEQLPEEPGGDGVDEVPPRPGANELVPEGQARGVSPGARAAVAAVGTCRRSSAPRGAPPA